ncbi:NAD(P)/FAD-dependent oxidoreductase [Billgrantia kenyensis]|uniref:FAD-dependent oxidoreductase n=1 Tax=Billgrantia kenyensis TaxID=321266 RepID=A0A7V9VXX3_9GAMM|nr:FAD-dependent oxidoreductase [Halomonas kenyensis]MBA2777463.1 FAD-dependent oxidoreductase [Halomonas kenyensis]MCG6660133.1 FAD-dependent oxidoreductase [Halomonas kenyensis]
MTRERPRILLVGAGHAHLYLMRNRWRLAEACVTVVDPAAFWYSGMAAGVLGGALSPVADRIDPKRLAARHRFDMVRGRLERLDRENRLAVLEDGRTLGYDLLSLNLGSYAPTLPVRDRGSRAWSVKPIPQLVTLRRCLETGFRRGERARLIVVGGGASGVELACNLRALANRHAAPLSITLVSRGETLLAGAPRGARRWLHGYLSRLDIQVCNGLRAVSHHPLGLLVAEEGVTLGQDTLKLLECEHVVHAGGLEPPPVLERLGLPVIAGRGLALRDTLQSVDDPDIFAAGDCAALSDTPLPRLGVYGVRQAPVLLANLQARLRGRPPQRYTPQSRALTILNLGPRHGLAIRGRLWWAGRASLAWKHWLDERFMAQYRT